MSALIEQLSAADADLHHAIEKFARLRSEVSDEECQALLSRIREAQERQSSLKHQLERCTDCIYSARLIKLRLSPYPDLDGTALPSIARFRPSSAHIVGTGSRAGQLALSPQREGYCRNKPTTR